MPLLYGGLTKWVANLTKIRGLCGKYNPDATTGSPCQFAKKKLSDLLANAALVQFKLDIKKEFPGITISISDSYSFAKLTDGVSPTTLHDSVWAFIRSTCDSSCLEGGDLNPKKSVQDAYPAKNDVGWNDLKDGIHAAGLDKVIEEAPKNVNTKLEGLRSAPAPKPLLDLLTYLSPVH